MKAGEDQLSVRTPSNEEKKVGIEHIGSGGYGELPPDPDAGLSDEEKARIVRLAPFLYQIFARG
jgi:hypothetical protein